MQVYTYPPLVEGILIRRYQRFFAEIEIQNGEVVIAHCPNTGSMKGICIPGNRVFLSQTNNPKRKLLFTWELIEINGELVGINTALPNHVIGKMIHNHLIPELEPYFTYKTEVPYGKENSRIDFLLSGDNPDRYVEVKNTTWSKGRLALFPDTVTLRGQKHLRELTNMLENNQQSTIIYFIHRGDCDQFSPGDEADPQYGEILRTAVAKGLQLLACRFKICPTGIDYLGTGEIKL